MARGGNGGEIMLKILSSYPVLSSNEVLHSPFTLVTSGVVTIVYSDMRPQGGTHEADLAIPNEYFVEEIHITEYGVPYQISSTMENTRIGALVSPDIIYSSNFNIRFTSSDGTNFPLAGPFSSTQQQIATYTGLSGISITMDYSGVSWEGGSAAMEDMGAVYAEITKPITLTVNKRP